MVGKFLFRFSKLWNKQPSFIPSERERRMSRAMMFSAWVAAFFSVSAETVFLDTFATVNGMNDDLSERQFGEVFPAAYSGSLSANSITNEMLLRVGGGSTVLDADFSDQLGERDFTLRVYMEMVSKGIDWCAMSMVSAQDSDRSMSPVSFFVRGAPGSAGELVTVSYGTGGSTSRTNLTETFLNTVFYAFRPSDFHTYEIRSTASDSVHGTFDFYIDEVPVLQDLPYRFRDSKLRTIEWVNSDTGAAFFDNAELMTASPGPRFTLDYASLLSGLQSNRTDYISLEAPLETGLGTISGISVSTRVGSGAFYNSRGYGLAITGGANNAWFDSGEQIHLDFAIETDGHIPVHNMALELVGVAARAIDGDCIAFTSGLDLSTAVFRRSAGYLLGRKANLVSDLRFYSDDVLTVTAGEYNGLSQNTRLSSLTFRLMTNAVERPAVSVDRYLLHFHGNRGFDALNPEQAAWDADIDLDGLPNSFESLMGLDPTRDDSSGFFPRGHVESNQFVLSYTQQLLAPTGLAVCVEQSGDLLQPFVQLTNGVDYVEQSNFENERKSVRFSATATADQSFWRLGVQERFSKLRNVGIAYSTWHRTAFWGNCWTPSLGYYSSDDRDVIRQHGRLLAEANMDFVFVDWSNDLDYIPGVTENRADFEMVENTVPVLFEEWRKIPDSPAICIMLGFPDQSDAVFDGCLQRKVDQVYSQFIANPDTVDQYYTYLGKPLLIIYTGTPTPYKSGLPPFDDPRFTIRYMTGFVTEQDSISDDSLLSWHGYWSWEDRGPQSYTEFNGEPEACTVSAASRAQVGTVNVAAIGRKNGITFRDRFQRARDLGVKLVLVTTWNEWSINEQPSAEISKDLEPSVTAGAQYFNLLCEQVRLFKAGGYENQ
jgi:hypothetical protein